jgi:hypothetical protein
VAHPLKNYAAPEAAPPRGEMDGVKDVCVLMLMMMMQMNDADAADAAD